MPFFRYEGGSGSLAALCEPERHPARGRRLPGVEVVHGVRSRDSLPGYRQQVESLAGSPRVWAVFSHLYPWDGSRAEERYILAVLDSLGVRQESLEYRGSSVYRYACDRLPARGEGPAQQPPSPQAAVRSPSPAR